MKFTYVASDFFRGGCYIHSILYLKNVSPPCDFCPPAAAKSLRRAWLW